MEFKAKRTQKETMVTRRKLAVKRGKPDSLVRSHVVTLPSAVKRRKFRSRKLHGSANNRQATQEDLYLQYLTLNTAFLLVESALERTKACNKRAREGDDWLTDVILCKRAKYLDSLVPYPDFPSIHKKITYSRDFLLSLQFSQAPPVFISSCCMKVNSLLRSDRRNNQVLKPKPQPQPKPKPKPSDSTPQPKPLDSTPQPKPKPLDSNPQPNPKPLDFTSEKKGASKAIYVKKQQKEEEWIIHPQLLFELMYNPGTPGDNMAFFSKAGNILRQTVNKQVSSEICGSKPSVFQMMRHMSSSKVFIGGLSYNTDDHGLKEAFSKYGQVTDARVIMDRETNRSRGFGFVTYTSSEEASAAIQALDGQELYGRNVKVNYANDRPPRTFGGGPGGNYGGGNYGGGNYGGGSYGGGSYGGGSYGGNSGYQGGGNYPSGGGGGSYGGNNFGRGGGADDFGAGNQSFGAPGGVGGNDSGFGSEFGGSSGSAPFGNNDSGELGGPAGGFGQNEGNFGDDADEPGYANKA